MTDDKFSEAAFESHRGDRPYLRELSDLLQKEVLNEIGSIVAPAFEQIIARLNQMGHNLRQYARPGPGDIAFRDDTNSGADYDCKLRVALDVVISVGYADVLYSKSNPEGLSNYADKQ